MKGRKILLATVPLLAMATIVGAGFSTYYFENDQEKTETVNVSVDDYVTLGTVTVTAPTVRFNQTTADTPAGFTQKDGGITISQWTVDVEVSSLSQTGSTIEWGSIDASVYQIEYWWEIAESAQTYVETETTTTRLTNPNDAETSTENHLVFTIPEAHYDEDAYTNDELNYKAESQPTSSTEWDTYNTAVNGSKLTLHVSFTTKA